MTDWAGDEDWDMLGEDSLLKDQSSGGGSEGWGQGVDSNLYTTNISGVSSDLRAKAKAMARQIIGEKKGGSKFGNTKMKAPYVYHTFLNYIQISSHVQSSSLSQTCGTQRRRFRRENYVGGRRHGDA